MWVVLTLFLTISAFVGGFLLKVKSRRWCTVCGSNLACPDCQSCLTKRV